MENEGKRKMKQSDLTSCYFYVILITFKLVNSLILSQKNFTSSKISNFLSLHIVGKVKTTEFLLSLDFFFFFFFFCLGEYRHLNPKFIIWILCWSIILVLLHSSCAFGVLENQIVFKSIFYWSAPAKGHKDYEFNIEIAKKVFRSLFIGDSMRIARERKKFIFSGKSQELLLEMLLSSKANINCGIKCQCKQIWF